MQPKKTITSKSENIPKHLQNRKEFQKRQYKASEEKRTKVQIGSVLIIFALVLGAGLFVYNMDDVYLRDKKHLTLSHSTNFQQGGNAPIIVTLSDFEGAPVAEEKVKIELEYTQDKKT